MKTIKWSVSITLMLALAATVVKGFTIDGVLDAQYGSAIVTQQLNTSTSDNTEGLIDRANGSELDAAYGTVSNGVLYLFLAGNLDSDDVADSITFDKLQIFFMTGPGGDHTLGTHYNGAADFGHLNRMGTAGNGDPNAVGTPGLTFDTGFAANYWIGVNIGGLGSSPTGNVNYEVVCSNCAGAFLGKFFPTNTPPGNILVNGTFGIQAALNNSNTNGVTVDPSGCGASATSHPESVMTGVELAIPLSAIGSPTGQVSICAFITDDLYVTVYNQILGTITSNVCQGSFGESSAVDFSTIQGQHHFTLSVPPCNAFQLSPANATYGSSGVASNVNVGDFGGCSWTATSGVLWVTITAGGSGSGNGTVSYSVSSNTSINARTGNITIAGQIVTQSVTVTQNGIILPPLGSIIVDGTVDSGYGCPIAVQQLSTTYGKNVNSNGLIGATGSELDAAYGLVKDNVLFLLLAGNIQTNNNRVHIFFMTGPGGQNTLTNVNPNNFDPAIGSESVLNAMGPTNNPPGPGLTFDPGFAPNYYINMNVGTVLTSSFNYAQLWPGGTNASGIATNGYFLGRTGSTNGTLTGGLNPFLIQATVNNSNTNGVDNANKNPSGISTGCYTNRFGVANALQASTVTNGVEMAIPLAALGSPTGTIAICAFIGNNGNGLQMSDQILGPFGNNDPTFCTIAPGKTTNMPYVVLSNYPGQHYFYVGPEMRITSVGVSNSNVNVSYLTENNTNLLYRVERITGTYSTNSIWVPLSAFTPGTGGIITQTDTLGGTNKPDALYRVRQSPNCQ